MTTAIRPISRPGISHFTSFTSAAMPWVAVFIIISCSEKSAVVEPIPNVMSGVPSISGTSQYLASPFVTAGDRVYLVGHQDGTFPRIGWHIAGEMGGLWDHPIKLMDGFVGSVSLKGTDKKFCLDQASNFTNYPMGNSHEFNWKPEALSFRRFQFVPDGIEGLVIEFSFRNDGNEAREMIFSFAGMPDLRPTWLGERTGMKDAEDEIYFDPDLAAFIAKDQSNPWYTAYGTSEILFDRAEESMGCAMINTDANGKAATLSTEISLKPGEERTVHVFVAGSYVSEASLRQTYSLLTRSHRVMLSEKIKRYSEIDARCRITIPDKGIEQMYAWLKYNTDWLVRHVPEQGTGLGAGLPDYPWWFGADMAYSLQGVLATGDHTLAKNSIMLLYEISKKTNGNGRIIHEASTNGAVYNRGNVNETAQFITLIRDYFRWTGDKILVAQLYPHVTEGIRWLQDEMDPDRNGYPNGSGMMEIPGLDKEMIDVAVYTQQALGAAAELAHAIGKASDGAVYQQHADSLKTRINREWWNAKESSFGDFRGTVAEARPVLKAALLRADTLRKPWSVAELKATEENFSDYRPHQQIPHVIYHNWVVNTPMETGVADMEKGSAALQTAKKYENPFGVFVTGIDRTVEADSVVLQSRKKTFSYTGAVMTLPTGVQAVAAARYGAPEDALVYLGKLERSFSYALPGSMYEVSPDFGMMTQAWNIYGVAVPIVNYFFGVQPMAHERRVFITPRLPSSWNEALIENVRVGNNNISLAIRRLQDHTEYRIAQSLPDWTMVVDIKNATKVVVNQQQQDLAALGDLLTVTGRDITVIIFR